MPDLLSAFVHFLLGGLNSQDKTELIAFSACLGLVLGAIIGARQPDEVHARLEVTSILGGALLGKSLTSLGVRMLAR